MGIPLDTGIHDYSEEYKAGISGCMTKATLRTILNDTLKQEVPSQSRLAELTGYTQGYISKIFSGQKAVTRDFTKILAEKLSLSPSEYEYLLTALGISDYEETKKVAKDATEAERAVKAALEDEDIPSEIKKYITDDIQTIIQGWHTFLITQQLNHNRDWQVSEAACLQQLEAIDQLHSRLTTYLKTTQARARIHLGEITKARRQLERTMAESSSLEYSNLKALSYLYQGNIFRDEGKWEEALEVYKEARQIFDKLINNVEAYKVEKKIAIVNLFKGEYEEALDSLHSCMPIFKESNNTYEVVRTHFALAWGYNLSGEWDISLAHHQEGMKIAQNVLVQEDKATQYLIMLGHSFLGNDYRQRREPDEALKHYKKAHEMSEKFADKREQGWILLGLARVNGQLAMRQRAVGKLEEASKYYDNAVRYFEQARDKNFQIGFSYRQAMTGTHYGRFLLDYHRDDKSLIQAENILKSALEVAELIGSKYYQTQARVNLCDYYRVQKKGEMFKKHADAIEQMHKSTPYHRLMGRLRLIQAQYILENEQQTGDFDQATSFVIQAFDEALKHHILAVLEVQNRLNRMVRDTLKNRLKAEQITDFYSRIIYKLQQTFESRPPVKEKVRNWRQELLCGLVKTAEDIENKRIIQVELLD